MASRRTRHIFYGIRVALAWIVVAVAALLWQLNRSLPPFATHWLERKLSAGALSYHFERASFNVFRGVTLNEACVYVKRTLGPPLMRVGELRLDWDVDTDRPVYTWARGIQARDLNVTPFVKLPVSSNGVDVAGIFRNLSVSHDWLVEPRHVAIERADVFGVRCRYVEFDVSIKEAVLCLDNLRIVPDAVGYMESLQGSLRFDPALRTVRATLDGTITPDVIRDLTLFLDGAEAVEYYDAITGMEAPLNATGEVNVDWSRCATGGTARQDMRVALQGGGFRFRGRPVRRAKMTLQWIADPDDASDAGARLVISPLHAVFDDGTLDGGIVWYERAGATDLSATGALPARSLFQVIGLQEPPVLSNFCFATTPRVTVSGRLYDSPNWSGSAIGGRIEADKMAVRGVDFVNCAADWRVTSFDRIYFENIAGSCYGGAVTGHVTIAMAPYDGNPYTRPASDPVEGTVQSHFDFAGVGSDHFRAIFAPDAPPSEGRISGTATLFSSLDSGDFASIHGSAKLRVRKAELLRIPLFAGLTDFLGRNVVGVDLLLMQSDSDVSLSATNGLVTIERLTLDGNLLSLVAKGKCRLDAPGMPTEGVAQVRFFHSRSLMGMLARIATLPVSKLMEFRVYGPLAEPSWNYIGLLDRLAEATFWPREDATERPREAGGRETPQSERRPSNERK